MQRRHFYSRPYARGDYVSSFPDAEKTTISTHAPTRGATVSYSRFIADKVNISTHAPTRGATGAAASVGIASGFLLTPLREGRHTLDCPGIASGDISTHAPTRGATRGNSCLPAMREKISTHAPTRGATFILAKNFLPTIEISTHAPTRGATRALCPVLSCCTRNFYSRPYARGDLKAIKYHGGIYSISTHAPTRGATRRRSVTTFATTSFLLTPLREGRRIALGKDAFKVCISTHAPTRGATFRSFRKHVNAVISTHAPTRGATLSVEPIFAPSSVFLLTPLREGRRTFSVSSTRCRIISTHAPTRGATSEGLRYSDSAWISTHAPTRGATQVSVLSSPWM